VTVQIRHHVKKYVLFLIFFYFSETRMVKAHYSSTTLLQVNTSEVYRLQDLLCIYRIIYWHC